LHEGHTGWNRGAVTAREVVEDDGIVAGCNQLTNTMATDVTGTADDENLHGDRKLDLEMNEGGAAEVLLNLRREVVLTRAGCRPWRGYDTWSFFDCRTGNTKRKWGRPLPCLRRRAYE